MSQSVAIMDGEATLSRRYSVSYPKWVVAGMLLLLVGCGIESHSWNQKLMIVVETPDGERSGASVTRVTKTYQPYVPGHGGLVKSKIFGEAVVLQISKGRFLFGLLSSRDHLDQDQLAQKVFSNEIGIARSSTRLSDWASALSSLKARRAVSPDHYPLLVTFADISDPLTVAEVDPSNLVEIFGSGVRLKSMTLELTDEPVTQGGVQDAVKWINSSELLTNPKWRTLPIETQTAIYGLKTPVGTK